MPPAADYETQSRTAAVNNRDLQIPPGSHAFVQMTTTGVIKVHVGPLVLTFSGQERAVRFDEKTDSFEPCGQEMSIRKNEVVREGSYVVLENPVFDDKKALFHPSAGDPTCGRPLLMGRRVVVKGPLDIALWPRQKATIIPGHSLRSNQYLCAVVYDPESAKQNWSSAAIIAAVSPTVDPNTAKTGGEIKPDSADKIDAPKVEQKSAKIPVLPKFVMGERIIITGEDVSYYIPPTGVEVIPEDNNYVREAITLERLEYCILVDENGNKRYENGPAVVFPRPTEKFFTIDGIRKFKAIELPAKAGIHIKVIADHAEDSVDSSGKAIKINRKAGEELFLTGDAQPIYVPSEFHSIVKYGDNQRVHFGVAIPKGEGRYVMNRITGEIRTVEGPEILLCDPRNEVIVRRILSDKQCQDWYPDNTDALAHNRQLRQMQEAAGSSRGDVVEEYTRGISNTSNLKAAGMVYASSPLNTRSSYEERIGSAVMGDEFSRSKTFTPPRSLTLNTKYEGVPSIDVWTGFAVMIVDKGGNRRVLEGPATALLSYTESLEVLSLSTGKPKNTDKLYRTTYLRTKSNKVSDIIDVETSDHVRCQVKISFNVNFEGSPEKWFNSENYVKLLCDHVRSMLKGEAKKHTIEAFYSNATAIIRDAILGAKKTDASGDVSRPGLFFEENGMRVVDVEVLGNEIMDKTVGDMLARSQREVVEANIRLASSRRTLELVSQQEDMNRLELTARAATDKHRNAIELEKIESALKVSIEKSASTLAETQASIKIASVRMEGEEATNAANLRSTLSSEEQRLALAKKDMELDVERLEKETAATISRFAAAQGGFAETMSFLARERNLTDIAQACSIQTAIGGKNLVDAMTQIFGADSPVAKRLANLTSGAVAAASR